MNPFRHFQDEISATLSELEALRQQVLKLRQYNSTLINENITLENSLAQAKDSITEQCEACPLQGGQRCRQCSLYAFATTNSLWTKA
jgi:regulator of replication initiation timing